MVMSDEARAVKSLKTNSGSFFKLLKSFSETSQVEHLTSTCEIVF